MTNRVVVTNKTPTGLNRGFGGPQLYYALERLMQRIATELGLDPLAVIQRNLVPADAMPYRAAAGAVLDSGDFPATVAHGVADGALDALRAKRDAARAAGRLYGIGFAAAVEPCISNMGYITTVLTPEERRKSGPKDGAVSHATVAVDPLGAVTVTADSLPQGQGHRTVLAQVVGDALGLAPAQVTVALEHDSPARPLVDCRPATMQAASPAPSRAPRISPRCGCGSSSRGSRASGSTARPTRSASRAGRIFAAGNPGNDLDFRRVAALAHWSPGSLPEGVPPALRETARWTPPELTPPDEGDRVNSSAVYGFIFDFCGVEVDRLTGAVAIDRYVSTHDAGRRLNPALVDGQIRGAFAHAVGAALYEELAYSEDGSFLSGTLADYLVPTACEVPDPLILHRDSLSPVTPARRQGRGRGQLHDHAGLPRQRRGGRAGGRKPRPAAHARPPRRPDPRARRRTAG